MADQARWFKLWITAPMDDALQTLSPALRWAWAVFGCYTKAHGTRGRVEVSSTNTALAAQMCVPIAELHAVISALPHVRVEKPKSDNGTVTVTWENWAKYQEDSTVYERVQRLRAKKRRDEKRLEEKRDPSLSLTTEPLPTWPENLHDVRDWLVTQHVPAALQDPLYWQRIDAWLGGPDSGVGYLDECARYLAWLTAQPPAHRQKDLRRGFRNWLAKSEYWSEQRAQREAHQKETRR